VTLSPPNRRLLRGLPVQGVHVVRDDAPAAIFATLDGLSPRMRFDPAVNELAAELWGSTR
jgi:hypothetical protein